MWFGVVLISATLTEMFCKESIYYSPYLLVFGPTNGNGFKVSAWPIDTSLYVWPMGCWYCTFGFAPFFIIKKDGRAECSVCVGILELSPL